MAKKKKKQAPECCKGCASWEVFGEECWVYWEGKKECSMNTSKE
jgi:hypothetical protein